jgi:hypothetical protein
VRVKLLGKRLASCRPHESAVDVINADIDIAILAIASSAGCAMVPARPVTAPRLTLTNNSPWRERNARGSI